MDHPYLIVYGGGQARSPCTQTRSQVHSRCACDKSLSLLAMAGDAQAACGQGLAACERRKSLRPLPGRGPVGVDGKRARLNPRHPTKVVFYASGRHRRERGDHARGRQPDTFLRDTSGRAHVPGGKMRPCPLAVRSRHGHLYIYIYIYVY